MAAHRIAKGVCSLPILRYGTAGYLHIVVRYHGPQLLSRTLLALLFETSTTGSGVQGYQLARGVSMGSV